MAAIGASHFGVVISKESIAGGRRYVEGALTLTGGSDTYPTAGMPLPAIGQFGFRRNMDSLIIFGQTVLTTGYLLEYNKAAHKLQLFEEEGTAAGGPLLEADTSEAPGTRVWQFLATGW